jgi:Zn-dependent protease
MAARDPRASWLEEDPFHKQQQQQIPPPQTQFSPFLRGFIAANSEPQIKMHTGSLWHFSKDELRHLMLATGAFTLALGLMSGNGIFGIQKLGLAQWLKVVGGALPFMFLSVGPAFFIHEMAHKVVARHYGCWAEFRADPRGLKVGLIISLFLGVVFMAPGAVMVAGPVTRRENGLIAVAGPVSNLILLLLGVVLGAALIGIVGDNLWLSSLVMMWVIANSILGLFNMLPFGPLDGRKVREWSQPVFWVMISIFGLAVVSFYTGWTWDVMAMISTVFS